MDRFFRGFTAGVVGGVVMNLWTLFAISVLNLKVIRFIDWAGVIIFGDLPANHVEGLVALVLQLLWSGVLGIIFAFLIPNVTSQAYLLKGLITGVVFFFIIYAVPTILQTPILSEASLSTVISNQVGGALWGLVMAKTLYWLDRKQFTN